MSARSGAFSGISAQLRGHRGGNQPIHCGTTPHKKGPAPGRAPGPSGCVVQRDLDGPDGLGLRAPVALRDLELDPLAFFKAAVAIRLDS